MADILDNECLCVSEGQQTVLESCDKTLCFPLVCPG